MGEDLTNPRDSKYSSIPKAALNPLMILMIVELTSGSALPRDEYDAGTNVMIRCEVMGVSHELIVVISPYEVMLHYWEGNLLGLIAGDLIGATLWEGLPMIISCTLIVPTEAVQIVEWREAAHRVGIVHPHPAPTQDHPTPDRSPGTNPEQEAFQDRLEQVVRNESELLQYLEQYATQQDCVIKTCHSNWQEA